MIELLLPALLHLELCYSLCSTAYYCKGIQQLHSSQEQLAEKLKPLCCELGMVRQLKACLLKKETEAKGFQVSAELNKEGRLIFVLT